MYANVLVEAGTPQDVVTVPQTAVTYSLYGDNVFVVVPAKKPDPNNKDEQLEIERRFVKAGAMRDGRVADRRGPQAGRPGGDRRPQQDRPGRESQNRQFGCAPGSRTARPYSKAGAMHFTDIFVKRPVLATVVSLLILLAGLQAVFQLPIRQFPEVADTKIEITTAYPGANADQIKGFITTPLQQAVASTEGVETIESSSGQSISTITLKLRLDADADRALADVLSKVNEVKGVLPEAANDPVVKRTTGAGFALMYISFKSEQMTPPQISDYLDRVVRPRLQAINGVASAEILGGSTFAMRAWLDPDKMASLGITPLDVRNALAANNFTTAAGEVKAEFTQKNINAQTSLETPEEFEQLGCGDARRYDHPARPDCQGGTRPREQ